MSFCNAREGPCKEGEDESLNIPPGVLQTTIFELMDDCASLEVELEVIITKVLFQDLVGIF